MERISTIDAKDFKYYSKYFSGCGDKEEMCWLIGIKNRKFLLCCNHEIGVVDYLPLKEIDHKVDSDGDGEDEANVFVEMIEEMNVGEYIQMEVEIEMRWRKNDIEG